MKAILKLLKLSRKDLSTEDDIKSPLPANNLPLGYKEWPYVWNKSITTNKYGVAASAFQFMAGGGEPGYTWKIIEGKLPDGLELKADGTIADGLVNGKVDLNSSKGIISNNSEPGDYSFTVQVTDSSGNKASKNFTITVKERPNKWFEEGRVGALSHTIVTYGYFNDPNFSADLWAERAKRQGHSLVSVESLQQNYYWPSKFSDPKHERQLYYPKGEDGNVVDGIKQFEEAVKRYGMKFGLYYATEGGGLQHFSTDVLVQNVEDLIMRYDPAYLYFDGPQAMPNANFDVMFSSIRNHSDEIIVNSNAWGAEYGDPDLRTSEASHIYANAGANHLVKRTTMEPWKSVHTKNNYTPYYAKRDDYRQVAKEMIMNANRGYVDNNDQMPLMSRGTN
ncbi:putative Ig domain-containing protein [Paenibacillus sp. USDA918EY]|uniref:putative Ig domain-containing protein n=1 Tax=Paenibacillus sp. USDA918EY TaxID=2689575 RepID=UPI001F314A40|nr:putative Ig domain-containing protein [Paenibacillus sp. USDA918EY]